MALLKFTFFVCVQLEFILSSLCPRVGGTKMWMLIMSFRASPGKRAAFLPQNQSKALVVLFP